MFKWKVILLLISCFSLTVIAADGPTAPANTPEHGPTPSAPPSGEGPTPCVDTPVSIGLMAVFPIPIQCGIVVSV